MADTGMHKKGGYGKPPDKHKFKPGHSGNPGGRPKGSKSWKSVVEAELFSEIALKEQGVDMQVTKMEALAKRLVSNALAGNARALSELLRQVNLHLADADAAENKDLPASDDDVRLLLKYARRAVTGRLEEEANDVPSDKF